MAKVFKTYSCGCGAEFKELKAAEEHADNEGHSLTISGSITPEE